MNFNPMKKRRSMLLFCSLFFIIFIGSMGLVSGDIDRSSYLEPREAEYYDFQYDNETALAKQESAKKLIINFENNKDMFKFQSSYPLNVYLVNESEYSEFRFNGFDEGQENLIKMNWSSVKELNLEITYEKLKEFGFEGEIEVDPEGKKKKLIHVFVIVFNPRDELAEYYLRYEYENELSIFLNEFFRHVVFLCFLGVGIKLLLDAQKIKPENEKLAHIYENYGFGLCIGGVATVAWKIYHWYFQLNLSERWKQTFRFENMPANLQLSNNYLTWVTFTALGLSIVFMSNTIERDVQQKKIPYFTLSLIFMQIALIIGILVPRALLVIFLTWVAVVIFTVFNIFITYIKMLINTTGEVRKKAIFILVGLILAFGLIGLRDFIRPEYIGNGLGVIGIFMLFQGIKMDIIEK